MLQIHEKFWHVILRIQILNKNLNFFREIFSFKRIWLTSLRGEIFFSKVFFQFEIFFEL